MRDNERLSEMKEAFISNKGIGISIILKLVVGFMILSLVMTVMQFGALGEALFDGFSQINNETDYTAEVKNGEQLSNLALFVTDRVYSCNDVENRNNGDRLPGSEPGGGYNQDKYDGEEGYPHLSSIEHLTQKPDCYGAQGNRLIRGQARPADNFMPGILSRERFEIKSEILIDESRTSGGEGEFWLDYALDGVSKNPPSDMINMDPNRGAIDVGTYEGTGRRFVVFFHNETVAENRANPLLEDPPSGKQEYNEGGGIWYAESGGNPTVGGNWPRNTDFSLQLCPGDQGYIQVNIDEPDNPGTASKPGWAEDGDQFYYPRIVITKAGKCN